MAQMVIRQLDEQDVARLKLHASERRTSSEALAREAIRKRAAELTRDEKLELVRSMQARSRTMMVSGVKQTPGVELIRESRNVDH